jgi:hypothetical protein
MSEELRKRMEQKIQELTSTTEKSMVGTTKWYCDKIEEWQGIADLWKDISEHYLSEIEKLVASKQELQKKCLDLAIELAEHRRPKVREI